MELVASLWRNSSWWTYLFELVVCVLAVAWTVSAWRRKNLPPGPVGLPLFGYLPFLGKLPHKKLHSLSEKYGPVYSLYLGRHLVVVLNTLEVVREVLTNPVVMDRPDHPPNHLLPDSVSLSISNGAVWKEQRNFAVQVLRKLGMGKVELEDRIQTEISILVEKIDCEGGQPMNLARLLMPSVSNVILSLLTALKDPDGRRRRLLDSSVRVMTLYFRPTRIHAYFPSVKLWFAKLKIWGYDGVEKAMNSLSVLLRSEIDEHKNTLDPDRVRDYIDAFLLAQKKGNPTFTDSMLRGNVQSLLGAGSSPSRATLEWCLVSVATYQDVQERVYKEVAGEFPITWSSRHRTPYTMAVIMEAMRNYTVIPVSMLRTNSKPFRIAGFDVPEGTIIMTNIWAVHHDPQHWERPSEFWPERFLKEGKVTKQEAFIPFSYGRRNCPGEDLAWVEVYLYFATLVQKYHVLPAKGETGFKTVLGIANMAVLDNIRMIKRTAEILERDS